MGHGRQELGHKARSWDSEKSLDLLRRIDANGDGQVCVQEFTTYFDQTLPSDSEAFDARIEVGAMPSLPIHDDVEFDDSIVLFDYCLK